MRKYTFKLFLKKYLTTGNLAWEYNPLRNIISKPERTAGDLKKKLSNFDTSELAFDVNHPVDIECQPAYDGSVNIILNDDMSPPRLVNSAFSTMEDNTYKRVLRNQKKQTNYYTEGALDAESRLQRSTGTIMTIDLKKINDDGELPGGNYIFYIKYKDEDNNESRIVGESGVVSLFKGSYLNPSTCYGTLEQQSSGKSITLELANLDPAYNQLSVFYSRTYTDLSGGTQTEYKKIDKDYKISGDTMLVTVEGTEPTLSYTFELLNTQYNIYNAVKTTTQVQNILFFGNVQENIVDDSLLQQLSYKIQAQCVQNVSVGKVYGDYKFEGDTEYYNPYNIYNYLGYMPGEFYRVGIVYIFNDDSLSNVFNLRGCIFNHINEYNYSYQTGGAIDLIDPTEEIIDSRTNSKGVFRIPEVSLQRNGQTHPIALKFSMPKEVITGLANLKIKGYFYVRQKRKPIFLTQACSIGTSVNAYTPLLSNTVITESKDIVPYYFTQSIFEPKDASSNKDKQKYKLTPTFIKSSDGRNPWTDLVVSNGLLSTDAMLIPSLQTMIDGSKMKLKAVSHYNINEGTPKNVNYNYIATLFNSTINTDEVIQRELVYIPKESSYFVYKSNKFSTKAGSAEDCRTLRNLRWDTTSEGKRIDQYTVRGQYAPFIGVCGGELQPNVIYNIYTSEYPESAKDFTDIIKQRGGDKSSFMLIGRRVALDEGNSEQVTYGGDCFVSLASVKMQYNFLDSETPLNTLIVKPEIELNNYSEVEDWGDFNRSDWNAVALGYNFVYKCISNFNIGIRSVDHRYTDEMALYGGPRTFYPYASYTNTTAWKLPESDLINTGLSSSLGNLSHFENVILPYKKDMFDTRIAFSERTSADYFQNGYRIFKNLQYQDIDRQYGAIVKLESLGVNLFCVFEHGCGIININEKAVVNSENNIPINFYGTSVLPQQIQVVSPDYGSIWEESIIKTPNGIYGVDSFAKKIWRYTGEGFEIISDQITQRFLNDNLTLSEKDVCPVIAYKNIKSHYNNYKGDVMFTFYNEDKIWNLCYNERINKWVTRYSWTPLYSANIQNSFISTDQHSSSLFTSIIQNMNLESGLKVVPEKSETSESSLLTTYTYQPIIDEVTYNSSIEFRKSLDIVGFNDMFNHVRAFVTELTYPEYQQDGTYKIVTIDSTKFTQYQDSSSYLVGWGVPIRESYLNRHDLVVAEQKVEQEKHFYDSYKNAVWITFDAEAELMVKLDHFVPWISLKLNVTPSRFELAKGEEKLKNADSDEYLVHESSLYGDPAFTGSTFTQSITFLADFTSPIFNDSKFEALKRDMDALLRVGLYTHGRAGVHDEINYFDDNLDNQIKPTFWYGKQEPFELEFVVNSSVGIQKIFNNLVIISNNAEPESIEYEIIGDSYQFNKENIFKAKTFTKLEYNDNGSPNIEQYNADFQDQEFLNTKASQDFDINMGGISLPTEVVWDPILNQYTLVIKDECRNIKDYNRLLGNIEYKEDRWNVVIRPIYFKSKNKTMSSSTASTRIRDKWMKVRIRYKGNKLVVITAIQTLLTLSFA